MGFGNRIKRMLFLEDQVLGKVYLAPSRDLASSEDAQGEKKTDVSLPEHASGRLRPLTDRPRRRSGIDDPQTPGASITTPPPPPGLPPSLVSGVYFEVPDTWNIILCCLWVHGVTGHTCPPSDSQRPPPPASLPPRVLAAAEREAKMRFESGVPLGRRPA